MQTELIQLLQHEDYNNVKLGIYIAIANGYNAVDIVDNMYSYNYISGCKLIFVGDYRLRMSHYEASFLYFFKRKYYTFRLWNENDTLDICNDYYIRPKQYNNTYAEYAQHFIDLILKIDE